MEIIQVTDKKTLTAFHELPSHIYRKDENWVGPLRVMIEDVFDPKKNTGFIQGAACRWLVKEGEHVIGRIAAFYDRSKIEEQREQAGGIGFFECFDNNEAAVLLFDTARDWLKNEGLTAMDGPVNFGDNFYNWGLLVDGFQQQGFGMQYHPPYYKKLFERYGFQTYYRQFSYHLDITSADLPDRFWKIAEWVSKKKDFHYKTFSFKEQDRCIADFITIYQQAWDKHTNFKPVDPNDLKIMIKDARMLIEEDFIWYVYYKNEPIAFFMMIPDLNQILNQMKNGKLSLFNILKILYLKKRKKMTRCRVLVMGVIPKFQGSGIESGIFWQLRQVMQKKPWYNEIELSWVGDFNPKMIALFHSVGSKYAKTHETLRYLFDRSKPFERLTIIEE
ncbi:MAG TPA: GNAT family N-acetyltransferase [Prolixibacteraceae bacterium]|nr:GNAT family N-acetyltransferase [Prolixibacteraceae bacterium]